MLLALEPLLNGIDQRLRKAARAAALATRCGPVRATRLRRRSIDAHGRQRPSSDALGQRRAAGTCRARALCQLSSAGVALPSTHTAPVRRARTTARLRAHDSAAPHPACSWPRAPRRRRSRPASRTGAKMAERAPIAMRLFALVQRAPGVVALAIARARSAERQCGHRSGRGNAPRFAA